MRKLRVYVDTSVIGGCFDDEFADDSKALLEMARRGEITLLVSELLIRETETAPPKVKELLQNLPVECFEELVSTPEAVELRNQYLERQIVGASCSDDAWHVAMATVAKADIIVSWNFKHIVHYDKMRKFNAINMELGYFSLQICCPKEVV